jgi:hypothetical protein
LNPYLNLFYEEGVRILGKLIGLVGIRFVCTSKKED